MKKCYPLLFLLLLCFTCDEEVDCSAVLCAGPSSLVFEILQDGQNILDQGLITTDAISVTGDFPNSFTLQIQETNFNEDTATLLFIEQIAWDIRTYDFKLMVGTASSPDLSVTIGLSTGDCCGGIPQISQFAVDGNPLELPNQVVTITLD